MSSVDVLKKNIPKYYKFIWKTKIDNSGNIIKYNVEKEFWDAVSDGVLALEKLEKLKEWLIKSEDDFQLLRISVTGDKLKCWYLGGQFKILEEVRLLL